jgi:2-methylcitrate dehydratase PrpD
MSDEKGEDFAGSYAMFASRLSYTDIPDATINAARVNLFDTLTCSIAGFNAEGANEVRELVREWGGKPEAQILWSDARVPAPNAAWVNSVMAHARDFDDVHEKAIVHVGVSNVPAALAAVELVDPPVTGHEFFTGLVAGVELMLRMGLATEISLIESGFIYTSLFAYFGATATAARILNLSPEETHNALGIAYSQAAGGHQVTRDGAQTKRMQPGFAARAALTAIAMTKKGVVGPRNIFEGVDGLWRIYLQGRFNADALREGLGSVFHFEELGYKPYPSCRYNHTAIDAALMLREQPEFDWRDVSEIRAYTTVQGYEAVGTPLAMRQHPQTLPQAQFSICYNIACALVNGRVSLADFDDTAMLARPEISRLSALVVPYVDEQLERDWSRNISPTRLEAVVGDRTFTVQCDYAKGSLQVPFSVEDTRHKLEDSLAVSGFGAARADLFEKTLDDLLYSQDVAADLRRLSSEISAR